MQEQISSAKSGTEFVASMEQARKQCGHLSPFVQMQETEHLLDIDVSKGFCLIWKWMASKHDSV